MKSWVLSVGAALVVSSVACSPGAPPAGVDVDGRLTPEGAACHDGEDATVSLLTCGSALTLSGLVACIRNQMPAQGSEGFVVPTASEQADWRSVVAAMLGGACGFALPASLASAMRIATFTDVETGKDYCVLMEVEDGDGDGCVDRGWGTFVVDPAATRELSHQAPHPSFDTSTETEAVDVFKWTDSRSYLLCGAHRHANSQASACDPEEYLEADCAHATANMFYPTVLQIAAFYGATPHTQIQWHGMGYATCPGVNAYLSPGRSGAPPPGANVLALQANVRVQNPTWNVDVPGAGTCSQTARDNVEGRFLNGVAEAYVCAAAATSSSGKFVSIEQQMAYRTAASWIPAVKKTWPAATVPAPPAAAAAMAGNEQMTLR
jgi:hypothetical protein